MFKREKIPVINTVSPNEVAGFDRYHLSYNPSSTDYGSDTTAIVYVNNIFLILNGNHKDVLYEISEKSGSVGCLEYFMENIDKANYRSDHRTILKHDKNFSLDKYALEYFGAEMVERIRAAVEAHDAKQAVDEAPGPSGP